MWMMNATEGTAVATPMPVAVDGALIAVVQPLWDDEAGVQVSVDLRTDNALNGDEAAALAAALTEAASVGAPR